jgi:hypothetical protein
MQNAKLYISDEQIEALRSGATLVFEELQTTIAWWGTPPKAPSPIRYECFIDEVEERSLRAGETVPLPGNMTLSLCDTCTPAGALGVVGR